MTQIQWDRQTDGRTVRWEARRHSAENWGIWTSPTCWISKGLLSTVKTHNIKRIKPVLSMQLFLRFSMFLQLLDRFTCVKPYGYALCIRSGLCSCNFCVLSMCVENTLHSAWNIKRWRWRCPFARIGCRCVMILSRAMSCGNGCRAHPLITSMFTPHQYLPCFPTEQMTFMPETISPLDCGMGVFSRCTERSKQL